MPMTAGVMHGGQSPSVPCGEIYLTLKHYRDHPRAPSASSAEKGGLVCLGQPCAQVDTLFNEKSHHVQIGFGLVIGMVS